jgi:WD40 repeat protein/tRNA A-37 threonylcarbamoyl transferase component Bud32/anti-sigma factor RsiW
MHAAPADHPHPTQLAAFALGRLSAQHARAVEQHLAGCDTCGRLIDRLQPDSFVSALRDAARTPPPHPDVGIRPLVPSPPGGEPRAGVTVHEPDVAPYEVIEEIAAGGMGVVYKARQPGLNRTVAVKMVLGEHRPGRLEVRRFLAEAEAVAAIDHPHVIRVFEFGEAGGRPYLVMEYLPGGTLAGRLRGAGRLAPRDAAALLAKVARGVQAAHDAGIVHRDLKPGNVLFDDRGEPKVVDFGLAKRAGSDLTRTGTVIGTPAYVAPEIADGRAKLAGPAADVWAVGVILYQCLTGQLPFDGPDAWAILTAVTRHDPRPPRRLVRAVPRDLEVICLKCLAKDARDRYESAAALAADLERFRDGKPVLARPVGPVRSAARWAGRHPAVAGLLAAVVAVAFAGFVLVLGQWLRAEAATRLANDRADGEAQARQEVEDQKKDLKEALEAAEAARGKADEKQKELKKALDAADRNLSYHQVALADRYLQSGDVTRADRYLDACPAELRRWEWHYLKRLGHRDSLVLPQGQCGRFSPDGKAVATASGDRVWLSDATTGAMRRTCQLSIPEPNRPQPAVVYLITDLVFHPGGHTLAVAGTAFHTSAPKPADAADGATAETPAEVRREGFVALLNPADGTKRAGWTIAIPLRGKDLSYDCRLAYSPDGTRLAVATSFQSSSGVTGVWVYGSADGKVVKYLKDSGFDVAFSPDGKRLAFTARVTPSLTPDLAYDNLLRVWDLDADREVFTVREKIDPCTGPHAFSPDGKLVYSRHWGDVYVRDADTGREVRRLAGAVGNTLALSPDGRLIATDWGTALKVLDAATGQVRDWIAGPQRFIWHVTFAPDGKRALVSSWNGGAEVWEVGKGPDGLTLPGSDGATAQALSPDGTLLATRRTDSRTGCIDLGVAEAETGKPRHTFRLGLIRLPDTLDTAAFNASPMAFSADNRLFAASIGKAALVWDLTTGQPMATCPPRPAVVAGLPLGCQLATWLATCWASPGAVITGLALSPDGKRLATLGRDGVVRVWEAETGKPVVDHPAPQGGEVKRIVFSPDGRWLAAVGSVADGPPAHPAVVNFPQRRGRLWVWEAEGRPVIDWRDEQEQVLEGLAFGPRDTVAVLSSAGKVALLDTRTWAARSGFASQQGFTSQVAFTPDGTRLALLGRGTIQFWDPATGQEVFTLGGVPPPNAGHTGLYFSRDGHRLYYQNHGPMRYWDAMPLPPEPAAR